MTDNSLNIARKALADSFRIFDTDNSGFIELHELALILNKLTESFHVEHPTEEDVKVIFDELDRNGDGKISQL